MTMKPYLMIIDDSVDQVELMKAVFNMVDSSLKLIAVGDGDEALYFLRQSTNDLPRVILLDLRLPKKTGHEVLSEIKSDVALRNIPICTFSSSDNPKDIKESYERGASFYFKKPTGIQNLTSFVQHFQALWFDFASTVDSC